MSELKEKCGVFGISNTVDAATLTALGLHALQHRGQDAAGMVVCNETGELNSRKSMGYVRDVFQQSHMNKLNGNYGIGHVRYPTAGGAGKEFSQFKKDLGELASSKLSPISLEMNKLMKDEKYLDTIISNGKDRAINIANPVLSKIYEIIGFFTQ